MPSRWVRYRAALHEARRGNGCPCCARADPRLRSRRRLRDGRTWYLEVAEKVVRTAHTHATGGGGVLRDVGTRGGARRGARLRGGVRRLPEVARSTGIRAKPHLIDRQERIVAVALMKLGER